MDMSSNRSARGGVGGDASGAKVTGEFLAELLVLEAESGDLAAVGAHLLAQGVDGRAFGCGDGGGAAGRGVAELVDLVAQLVLTVSQARDTPASEAMRRKVMGPPFLANWRRVFSARRKVASAGKSSQVLAAAGVKGAPQPLRASRQPASSSWIRVSCANLAPWRPVTLR